MKDNTNIPESLLLLGAVSIRDYEDAGPDHRGSPGPGQAHHAALSWPHREETPSRGRLRSQPPVDLQALVL